MKRLVFSLLVGILLSFPVYAKDTVHILTFSVDDVGTAADSAKTALKMPAKQCKMILLTGGMEQGESGTCYDIHLYSDNVAATEQEDIIYPIDDITTGYHIDYIPQMLRSNATSGNYIYWKITNDGAESDYSFEMHLIPWPSVTYP